MIMDFIVINNDILYTFLVKAYPAQNNMYNKEQVTG